MSQDNSMETDKPTASVRRVIYPPVWMVFGIVAVFALNEFFPGVKFASTLWQIVGGAILLAGLVTLVMANGLFARAKTDIIPFRNVTTLLTDGVYRFSRNPIYLGMAAVLLGCALTVGAATALPVPIVFALIIQYRFIHAEEDMLRKLFPEEFPAYCARVRRWL
jgi:protein-S-isoprenylcysteine O-methyltransferase Ste14